MKKNVHKNYLFWATRSLGPQWRAWLTFTAIKLKIICWLGKFSLNIKIQDKKIRWVSSTKTPLSFNIFPPRLLKSISSIFKDSLFPFLIPRENDTLCLKLSFFPSKIYEKNTKVIRKKSQEIFWQNYRAVIDS